MRTQLRAVVFLALALVCATAAVWLARSAFDRARPERSESATGLELTPVLIATAELAAGEPVALEQTELREWPSAYLPSGHFSDPAHVKGRVLRRALRQNEPLLETDLLPVGSDGGLTALISEHHRAVSVKVDAVVGVAGFIKPGARVDVIATLRRVDQEREVPETRIILQDLRVLAIDQTLEERNDGEARTVNVVTLEVDPDESQKLAYAAAEGSLQLALRNPADGAVRQTRKMSVSDLLAGPRAPEAPRGPQVEAIRGSTATKETL
jgi:pilus assembly protein CpaB